MYYQSREKASSTTMRSVKCFFKLQSIQKQQKKWVSSEDV